ncbi:MAG TPA: hypothetical protein VM243_15895, partial [Phycisphaerae bacterium]|nr:hypothetical protein [Phycisphaerae bacterium]
MVTCRRAAQYLLKQYRAVLQGLGRHRCKQAAEGLTASVTVAGDVECLEPRLLLSSVSLSGDAFTLSVADADAGAWVKSDITGNLAWCDDGTSWSTDLDAAAGAQTHPAAALTSILIRLGDNGDQAVILPVLQSTTVTVLGGAGADTLTYDAQWQSVTSGAGQLTAGDDVLVSYSGIEQTQVYNSLSTLNGALDALKAELGQVSELGRLGEAIPGLYLEGVPATLGALLDTDAILEKLREYLVSQLSSGGARLADLVDGSKDLGDGLAVTFSAATDGTAASTIHVAVGIDRAVPCELDLGVEAQGRGVQLTAGASVGVAMNTDGTLEFAWTIDWTGQGNSSATISELTFQAVSEAAVADFDLNVGPLSGTVSGGTAAIQASVELVNGPSLPADIVAADLVAGSVADGFAVSLPFTPTAGIIGVVDSATFSWSVSDPTDILGAAASLTWPTGAAGEMLSGFAALTVESTAGMLKEFATVLDTLGRSELLNVALPLVDAGGAVSTLGELYNLAGQYQGQVLSRLIDVNGQVAFSSLQEALFTDSFASVEYKDHQLTLGVQLDLLAEARAGAIDMYLGNLNDGQLLRDLGYTLGVEVAGETYNVTVVTERTAKDPVAIDVAGSGPWNVDASASSLELVWSDVTGRKSGTTITLAAGTYDTPADLVQAINEAIRDAEVRVVGNAPGGELPTAEEFIQAIVADAPDGPVQLAFADSYENGRALRVKAGSALGFDQARTDSLAQPLFASLQAALAAALADAGLAGNVTLAMVGDVLDGVGVLRFEGAGGATLVNLNPTTELLAVDLAGAIGEVVDEAWTDVQVQATATGQLTFTFAIDLADRGDLVLSATRHEDNPLPDSGVLDSTASFTLQYRTASGTLEEVDVAVNPVPANGTAALTLSGAAVDVADLQAILSGSLTVSWRTLDGTLGSVTLPISAGDTTGLGLDGSPVTAVTVDQPIVFQVEFNGRQQWVTLTDVQTLENRGAVGQAVTASGQTVGLGFTADQAGVAVASGTAESLIATGAADVLGAELAAGEAVQIHISVGENLDAVSPALVTLSVDDLAGVEDIEGLADRLMIAMASAGVEHVAVGVAAGKLQLTPLAFERLAGQDAEGNDIYETVLPSLRIGFTKAQQADSLAEDLQWSMDEAFGDEAPEVSVSPNGDDFVLSLSAGTTIHRLPSFAGAAQVADLVNYLNAAIQRTDAAGVLVVSEGAGGIAVGFDPALPASDFCALRVVGSDTALLEAMGLMPGEGDGPTVFSSRQDALRGHIEDAVHAALAGTGVAMTVVLAGDPVEGNAKITIVASDQNLSMMRMIAEAGNATARQLGFAETNDAGDFLDIDLAVGAKTGMWAVSELATANLGATVSLSLPSDPSDGVAIGQVGMLAVAMQGDIGYSAATVLGLKTDPITRTDWSDALINTSLGAEAEGDTLLDLFATSSTNTMQMAAGADALGVEPRLITLLTDALAGKEPTVLLSLDWAFDPDDVAAGPVLGVSTVDFDVYEWFGELSVADLTAGLTGVADWLTRVSEENLSDTQLMIGQSLHDLLDLASAVSNVSAMLEADPATTVAGVMQQLAGVGVIGIDATREQLTLDLDLSLAAAASPRLVIDFDLLSEMSGGQDFGVTQLAGADDGSAVSVMAGATFDLQLRYSLHTPDASSTQSATLAVGQNGSAPADAEALAALLNESLDALLAGVPGVKPGDITAAIDGSGTQVTLTAAAGLSVMLNGASLPTAVAVPANPVQIVTTTPGGLGADEVQTITIDPDAVSSFSLRVFGRDADEAATAAIAVETLAADPVAAGEMLTEFLESLYGVGNVQAAVGDAGLTITVTFTGALAGVNVGLMQLARWDWSVGELVIAGGTQPTYAAGLDASSAQVDVTLTVGAQGIDGAAVFDGLSAVDLTPIAPVAGSPLPAVPNDVAGAVTMTFTVAGAGLMPLADRDDIAGLFAATDVQSVVDWQADLAMFSTGAVVDFRRMTIAADPGSGHLLVTADGLAEFVAALAPAGEDSLLADPTMMSSGLEQAWSQLDQTVNDRVAAMPIPLLGEGFANAFGFLGDMGRDLMVMFNQELLRPDPAVTPARIVQRLFYNLFGPEADEIDTYNTVQSLTVTPRKPDATTFNYLLQLARAEVPSQTAGRVLEFAVVHCLGGQLTLKLGDHYIAPFEPLAGDGDLQLTEALEYLYGAGAVQVEMANIPSIEVTEADTQYTIPPAVMYRVTLPETVPTVLFNTDLLTLQNYTSKAISSTADADTLGQRINGLPCVNYTCNMDFGSPA